MIDKDLEGTAGSALAAHSKDASIPSSNPATSKTGVSSTTSPIDGISETVGKLASQARDAASKASSSVSEMAGQARDQLAEHGITADQAASFVREKPLTALLAAGGIGVILGILIARR